MTVRLLIADHDRRSRALVRSHLRRAKDIEIVGEVGEARTIVTAIEDVKPDVALIHEGMPGIGAIESKLADFQGLVMLWTADHHGEFHVRAACTNTFEHSVRAVGNIENLARIVRRAPCREIGLDGMPADAETAVPIAQHADVCAALELTREALSVQLAELEDKSTQFEFAKEALGVKLEEMQQTYAVSVRALASSVELRDEYTGGHIERVCRYTLALARAFDTSLMSEELVFGYVLHDIGKLAIPDAVLLKPGRLTEPEFKIIETHTTEGAKYVQGIPFLRATVPLVRNHHERFDGRGYPDGLAGDEIPLVARLFTLGDALDAMTTDRPYRPAMSLDQAHDELLKNSGSQFDPLIVSVFLDVVQHDDAYGALRAGVIPGRAEQLGAAAGLVR